ncbi:hypothetical protein V6N11_070465 [Hibiscus sabdariffa]|uniref:Reverse transcriptase zinc-binding domain-containing protein n=1 Tax=Hibiscus sabdariffa TaxID=183260 RepID=A0ABR2QFG8_9ROSI
MESSNSTHSVLKARYYPRTDFLNANLGARLSLFRGVYGAQKGLIEKDASNATWKYDILEGLFDEEHKRKICSIPLSRSGLNDELIWRPEGSGAYSVRSGYRLLRNDRFFQSDGQSTGHSADLSKFYTELWTVPLPAKVKITMWRIAHNFLSTYANLQNRRLNVNNICSLCQSCRETIVRDCWFSRHLLSYQGVHLPTGSIYIPWKDWLSTFFVNLSGRHKRIYMVPHGLSGLLETK